MAKVKWHFQVLELPSALDYSWDTLSAAVLNTENYSPGREVGEDLTTFPRKTLHVSNPEEEKPWAIRPYITPQLIQYLLLFHIRNSYANAPECDVIRTLPLLLVLDFCWLVFVSEMRYVFLEIGASHTLFLSIAYMCLSLFVLSRHRPAAVGSPKLEKNYF